MSEYTSTWITTGKCHRYMYVISRTRRALTLTLKECVTLMLAAELSIHVSSTTILFYTKSVSCLFVWIDYKEPFYVVPISNRANPVYCCSGVCRVARHMYEGVQTSKQSFVYGTHWAN